jgi:hypothetical protein
VVPAATRRVKMEFKIRKNKELPADLGRASRVWPFRDMAVKDSITVPAGPMAKSARQAAIQFTKSKDGKGREFSTKSVDAKGEKARGDEVVALEIWRIK